MNRAVTELAPVRLRRRARVLAAAVVGLTRLELTIRSRPLPRLCADAGIAFAGFDATPTPPDDHPLPRRVADAWWAAETVMSIWPLARRRPCLRRSLLLGGQLASLNPELVLEVTSVRPFGAHAVLMVRGHRLDLGEIDDPSDLANDATSSTT